MKKVLLLSVLGVLSITFYSCLKKDVNKCPYRETEAKAPDAEMLAVKAYLEGKGIEALKDSSGVFYIVGTEGSGAIPDVCSNITINYVGKLAANDVEFDKTTGTPFTYTLGALIPGWIKGLKHVKPGGKIKLYIPPSLAYGSAGASRTDQNGNQVVVIPPNAILVFDIELIAVQ